MTQRVCVLGAGHSAHVMAGLVASLPDHECHVYAPRKDRAERWRDGLARGGIVVQYSPDAGGARVQGTPLRVSKHPEEVVLGCQVLILCLPAQAYEENLCAVAPFVHPGAMIGTICASNGFDWCVDSAMAAVGRHPTTYGVFAMQNLPWACRATEYGVEVAVLGAKPWMEIVGRPASRLPEIAQVMSGLLRVPCPPVEGGFLGVGLSNMTQVLHPAIMFDNFRDFDGTPYPENPLFYQGLREEAAETMSAVSDEIMAIRARLEERFAGLHLEVVHHVWDWTMRAYEAYITDPSTLRTRFSTNRAFAGLRCPMREAEGGWLPDFSTRYLSEDVPFNLMAVEGLAELSQVPTPTIDGIVEWAQGVMGKQYLVDGQLRGADLHETFAPQRFGFDSLDSIPELRAAGADTVGR